jgi:hypothetical protein
MLLLVMTSADGTNEAPFAFCKFFKCFDARAMEDMGAGQQHCLTQLHTLAAVFLVQQTFALQLIQTDRTVSVVPLHSLLKNKTISHFK